MSLPEDRLSFLQLLLRREIEVDHEHALKISCRVAQRLILQVRVEVLIKHSGWSLL